MMATLSELERATSKQAAALANGHLVGAGVEVRIEAIALLLTTALADEMAKVAGEFTKLDEARIGARAEARSEEILELVIERTNVHLETVIQRMLADVEPAGSA